MHFTDIQLPTGKDELIGCYIYTTVRLRELWVEYVSYAETVNDLPTTEMFKLIFSEMDFFEGLRQRITDRLPPKVVEILRKVDDYSSW
jgi:hypothetical protein